MKTIKKGFTLVELLIVMAILGVLVALVAGNFRSSQIRGRDAQRKSDLKQLSIALELFFNDFGYYPPSSNGKISGCPFISGVTHLCEWGEKIKFSSTFSQGEVIYLSNIPADPSSDYEYYYNLPDGNNKKFQLFARIENSEDQDCMCGDCENPPVLSFNCGSSPCNFSITSSNTTYLEGGASCTVE